MLVVENLHAGYGRIPILMGLSLTVAGGEFVGIRGHNGMGKSTLMRTLTGYLPVTAGTIRFEGAELKSLKIHQRVRLGIGYVPQGREIFPDLSVRDNLRMGLPVGAREDAAIIDDILHEFPRLVRLLDRRGGSLSGGEQQLLALARCLCGQPKLILLDEPTEGVQPSIIDEMIDTLLRLRRTRGLTMVLAEQNLDMITSLSDRVLIIQKGRIFAESEASDHIW